MIMMCLFVVSVAGAGPDPAVRSLIDGGHWKQARAVLEPRVKANPNDAEAAALLSRVRHQYGDFDGALALAETAVRLEPKVADYHWQLAEVVGEMAQRASVFKQFGLGRRFKQEAEAAIALDARHVEAREGLIDFYIQAPGIIGGDRKKADQMADEIARIDPAAGYLSRAQVLLATKADGDFESLYKQAVSAARTPALKFRATAALMNVYLSPKSPKYPAAEEQARALLAIDPHRTTPYTALAIIDATGGRLPELDAVLADAEKAVPDNFNPFLRAGIVLLVQGKELMRAERFMRKYLSIEPEAGATGHAQAHWRLGQVLEKEGKRVEAIAEIEQAVRMKPDLEDAKKDLKRLK